MRDPRGVFAERPSDVPGYIVAIFYPFSLFCEREREREREREVPSFEFGLKGEFTGGLKGV